MLTPSFLMPRIGNWAKFSAMNDEQIPLLCCHCANRHVNFLYKTLVASDICSINCLSHSVLPFIAFHFTLPAGFVGTSPLPAANGCNAPECAGHRRQSLSSTAQHALPATRTVCVAAREAARVQQRRGRGRSGHTQPHTGPTAMVRQRGRL